LTSIPAFAANVGDHRRNIAEGARAAIDSIGQVDQPISVVMSRGMLPS
jgi:hypothetical protein